MKLNYIVLCHTFYVILFVLNNKLYLSIVNKIVTISCAVHIYSQHSHIACNYIYIYIYINIYIYIYIYIPLTYINVYLYTSYTDIFVTHIYL